MKKTTKILTVVCLLICAVMLVCVAAACNNPTSASTYTVTVKYPDGTPVSGVKVSWGNYGPQTTDADGKASIQLEAGEYDIVLADLPENYSYDAVKADASNLDKEITLVSTITTADYTITVLYPDNTPVVGASVSWCTVGEGGMCYFPTSNATDAQGKISMNLDVAEYHVQIIGGIPAGFTYDMDENNYYTTNATADARDITITLKSTGVVEVGSFGTYKVSIDSAEQGCVKFVFAPAVTGIYSVSAENASIGTYYAYMGDVSFEDYKTNYFYMISENTVEGIEVLEDQVGNVEYTFFIWLNGEVSYPVCFDVKVEKTGEVQPPIVAEIVQREATETLATCPDNANPDDSITYLTNASGMEKVDGFYMVDGKTVYVQLGNPIEDLFMEEGIVAWINGENITPYQFFAVKDGVTDLSTKYNFGKMICGVAYAGSDDTCDNYYGKYLNSDGLYYLTDELKEFLVCWANANGYNWYSVCCVYGELSADDGMVALVLGDGVTHTFPDGFTAGYFSFTAEESGYYALGFYGDMFMNSPIYEIHLGDAMGELIFFADEAEMTDWYSVSFYAEAGEEIVFCMFATEFEESTVVIYLDPDENGGNTETNPEIIVVDSDLDSAVGNELYNLTTHTATVSSETDGYYDILITAGKGQRPMAAIVITIGDENPTTITLNEENRFYVSNVSIPAGATITIATEDGSEEGFLYLQITVHAEAEVEA